MLAEEGESGLKYLFVDNEGVTRGYVLTRDRCQERTELDRMLIEPLRENVA